MTAPISFTIPGTPVGKGRPKFARRGNFVKAYTPEKTASYENLVKMYAAEAMQGRAATENPVAVEIQLLVTPPQSWSKIKQLKALAGEIRPTSKPDVDNVIKCLADACNEIVWRDDKQIVSLAVHKRYAGVARAEVTVEEL